MTDRCDIGSRHLDEGYFLKKKHKLAATKLGAARARKNSPLRHCCTWRDQVRSIKEEALAMIRNAREKVFVVSFRFGDPDLIRELCDAARRLCGGVYIITALDERSLERGMDELDEDAAPDARSLQKEFHDLTNRGIFVRGHESCHAKFLVVDDAAALVTSANFERRAFEKTGENGIALQNRGEVEQLARFFTRLWHSGCVWEMAPGKDYTVAPRQSEPSPCRVPPPGERGDGAAIWTDGQEQFILQEIQRLIGAARKELLLATFSLQGMVDMPDLLINPLRQAMEKRRLRVSLLARARNHFADHRRDARALAQLGVAIHADSLNHAKGIFADRKEGMLFSANFDASHGLTSGVEMGVRLAAGPVLDEAAGFLEHSMLCSDLEFVVAPTQRELHDRLAAKWPRKWAGETTVAVSCEEKIWNDFCSAAATGPVLFENTPEGDTRLLAGTSSWTIRPTEAGGYRELKPQPPRGQASADLLSRWLREQAGGGICPADFRRVSPPPGKRLR